MAQADSDPGRREYDRLATEYDRRWGHYVEATLRAVLDTLDFEGHERRRAVAHAGPGGDGPATMNLP